MTAADDGRLADAGVTPGRPLSLLHFLLIVAALTLVAAAVGFFAGVRIVSSAEQALVSKGGEPPALIAAPSTESANLKPLSPIVTNLAGSPPVWIRIEASLVFHEVPKDADALAARITEDLVGFLRTVPMKQLEGATGFQHLSEDLNDRVRVRSNGRVRELVIQGLIIE
jgi:flagellar FliL protein